MNEKVKGIADVLTQGRYNNLKSIKGWLHAITYGFGSLALAYVGMSFVIYLLTREFGVSFNGTVGKALSPAIQFGTLVLFAIAVVYLLDIHKYIHKPTLELSSAKIIISLMIVMLVVQIAGNGLIQFSGIEYAENQVIEQGQQGDPIYYLYMIPVMILFVGPVEEIIFRGILQGSFRENLNTPVAILITSLIFGLAHVSAVGGVSAGAVPYVIMSGTLGAILGTVYEYTENIFVPALSHGLYNTVLLLISYTAVTYNVDALTLFF